MEDWWQQGEEIGGWEAEGGFGGDSGFGVSLWLLGVGLGEWCWYLLVHILAAWS